MKKVEVIRTAEATHLEVAIEKRVQQRQKGGGDVPACGHRQCHSMNPQASATIINQKGDTHFLKEADAKERLESPREASTQTWEAKSSIYDNLRGKNPSISGKPVCRGQKNLSQRGITNMATTMHSFQAV